MPLYPSSTLGTVSSSVKGPDLPSVESIEELSQLPTQPNAKYPYFDKNDDVFYVVSTNENNFKSVSRYRFYEDPIPKPEDNYATKQEILDLKEDIANVQQSIQQLIEQTKYRPKNKQHNGSDKANVQNGAGLFQSAADAAANGYEQSSGPIGISNDIRG